MRKIIVVLVAISLIGSINSYAAFPTFVWTDEYRSELYAVEMLEEGVDDTAAKTDAESITVSLLFDTAEDDPATPSDLDTTAPDEGMNIAVDDEIEEDTDAVAQFITSYDIEPTTAEENDTENAAGEEDTEPTIDTQEKDTEPEEEDQEG